MLSLADTLSLKSVYSLRLYEMLKSALDYKSAITKGTGEQIIEYDLTLLKLELGIINSGGDNKIKAELAKDYPDYDLISELVEKTGQTKYKEYKIFNRNVLAKAKEELNKKTSLLIDYEPIKSGRKTVGIRFYVDEKESAEKVKAKKEINKDDVLDELIEYMIEYFRVKEIREIAEFADYDLDKIKKAYDYMLNYGNEIEVPIAFIKECIKNEYYLNTPKKPMKPKNSFNNFENRTDLDFEELERKLLDN